jgi:membrane fusion protein (multidrug efflux system)
MFVIDQRPYQTALQSAEAQVATAQAQLVTARAALTQAMEQTALAQAQAQLAAVEAPLVNAEQQLKRDQYLLAQGAVAQQQVDNDTATEQAAQATVTAQEATVKNTALSQQIGIAQARAGVQQAEAGVAQAEAAVAQAKLNLVYTTVSAPIDGVVGLLSVDQGNLVAANQLLATMSSVDPMVVQFNVSERTFLELQKRAIATAASTGQPVANIRSFQLILSDGSSYPQDGTFRTLDRAVDPTSGTIIVQALFPNPERLLKPGMYARVRARVEERPNAVLIPQAAVQEVQGIDTVFVVGADNTAAVRSITEGGSYGPFFVVLSGLKAGERVVVEGVQKIQPGMTVTPTVQAPPPVPAETQRP